MSAGSELSAARQAHGRSVEDLSAVTRIRPHIIRAIEADDFAACGGDVYARGHVRALAKALGEDAEPLLAAMTASGRTSAPLRAPAADPSLVLRERRSAPGWMTALAVVLGVMVCLAALRLVLPTDPDGATVATVPTTKATAPVRAGPVTPSPRPSRTFGTGTLAVSFAVTGSQCWLAVKDSRGRTRVADTLSQGQTATFRDKRKLSIVVGDVTAVAVTVNGQEVTLKGARGGVKRFVVRASDPLAAFGDGSSGPGGSRSPGA